MSLIFVVLFRSFQLEQLMNGQGGAAEQGVKTI